MQQNGKFRFWINYSSGRADKSNLQIKGVGHSIDPLGRFVACFAQFMPAI
jgi:hypothetical protein